VGSGFLGGLCGAADGQLCGRLQSGLSRGSRGGHAVG